MSQNRYSPYSNQFSPLWGATKAGAFVDAMDQATKAGRRNARYQKAPASLPSAAQREAPRRPFYLGLTPRRLTAALAVIIFCGLTAASLIA